MPLEGNEVQQPKTEQELRADFKAQWKQGNYKAAIAIWPELKRQRINSLIEDLKKDKTFNNEGFSKESPEQKIDHLLRSVLGDLGTYISAMEGQGYTLDEEDKQKILDLIREVFKAVMTHYPSARQYLEMSLQEENYEMVKNLMAAVDLTPEKLFSST